MRRMSVLALKRLPAHGGGMQVVTDQIRNFLQYIAVQFIEHPAEAQLKVLEQGPGRVRFKLVLRQSDVALLIGRNGFSASAIRGVAKAAAERGNVNVSLQIHSHEEEAEMLAREKQACRGELAGGCGGLA